VGIGEQIGYGAAGFVKVVVKTQSTTAAPDVLVLHRVQFMTAIGLRICAK